MCPVLGSNLPPLLQIDYVLHHHGAENGESEGEDADASHSLRERCGDFMDKQDLSRSSE